MDKLRQKSRNTLVAIDGSVNSVVNPYLLKKQNYKCSGISFYLQDDSLKVFNQFFNVDEKILDLISNKLDLTIKRVDVSLEFKDQVIDPLLAGLIAGKFFNLEHKIEQFIIEMLYRNKAAFNAEFISIPLSAKVLENQKYQSFDILEGPETQSDQSCFLAGIKDDVLKSLAIGVSDLRSSEVDKVFTLIGMSRSDIAPRPKSAHLLGLFENKDFLEFLNTNIPTGLKKRGPIKDNQTNNVVGEHLGLFRYVVGMNTFPIINKSDPPVDAGKSVVKIITKDNEIVIDNINTNQSKVQSLVLNGLKLSKGIDFNAPMECYIKLGAGLELIKGDLFFKTNHYARVDFSVPQKKQMAIGQIVYLYSTKNQKAKLVGSAQIEKMGEFINSTFTEAPYGILEKNHIAKYENAKTKKTINYL